MPDNNFNPIIIIDQTLREGMQFQGLVFSLKQRIRILEFQEALGVNICQIGYPPAHPMEAKIVAQVAAHAKKNNFKIRTAALGRAFAPDAKILCDTGIDDPHFHLHIKNTITREALTATLKEIERIINMVRSRMPSPMVSIAMLDIGKTDPVLLERCAKFMGCLGIDILSLPDTSGIMAPNQVYDKIKNLSGDIKRDLSEDLITNPVSGPVSDPARGQGKGPINDSARDMGPTQTKISVHCHNDMGMGSANSVMGILAGASVLEVSALGIGERNGIGDLFTTAKLLKDQGMDVGIDTNNLKLFKAYYGYLDSIVREQTGHGLIQCSTPAFGEAVQTHVAGTHARGEFGTILGKEGESNGEEKREEKFYLNLLCGKALVQKYLDLNQISHDEKALPHITRAIKTRSITLGRRLTKDEIIAVASSLN